MFLETCVSSENLPSACYRTNVHDRMLGNVACAMGIHVFRFCLGMFQVRALFIQFELATSCMHAILSIQG